MKERGILFSAPMVRALLAGTKTQTRRLVKPQPPDWCEQWGYSVFTPPGNISGRGRHPELGPAEHNVPLKYGRPGDRLWVRETFDAPPGSERIAEVAYRADYERDPDGAKWRPSIYMPRWASRITLEVTEVRVERLQSISEGDARAEGVTTEPQQGKLNGKPATLYPMTHRQAFIWLWDAINRERATWASDPWCWVIGFKRIAQARSAAE